MLGCVILYGYRLSPYIERLYGIDVVFSIPTFKFEDQWTGK